MSNVTKPSEYQVSRIVAATFLKILVRWGMKLCPGFRILRVLLYPPVANGGALRRSQRGRKISSTLKETINSGKGKKRKEG